MIVITRTYSDRKFVDAYPTFKSAVRAILHMLKCQRGPGDSVVSFSVEFGK